MELEVGKIQDEEWACTFGPRSDNDKEHATLYSDNACRTREYENMVAAVVVT